MDAKPVVQINLCLLCKRFAFDPCDFRGTLPRGYTFCLNFIYDIIFFSSLTQFRLVFRRRFAAHFIGFFLGALFFAGLPSLFILFAKQFLPNRRTLRCPLRPLILRSQEGNAWPHGCFYSFKRKKEHNKQNKTKQNKTKQNERHRQTRNVSIAQVLVRSEVTPKWVRLTQ